MKKAERRQTHESLRIQIATEANGSSVVCRCLTGMIADKVNAPTLALNILLDDADDVVQGTAFPTDPFWFCC